MTDRDADKQAERFAALLAEQFDGQLTKIVETMDSRIEHHIEPLQRSMDNMQANITTFKVALKDTNVDVKTLREDLSADIRLLKQDTQALKTGQKATNQTIKSLGNNVGKVEHRLGKVERKVDDLTNILTDSYLERADHDRALLYELDKRVGQLEKTAA